MVKKKVLLVIAFVVIALISCGIVSAYEMKPESKGAVHTCEVSGCTQTGEHHHDVCDIEDCTETCVHMHNGEYCYPHHTEDEYTHNTCGMDGCTQVGENTHHRNNGGHHHSEHH